jgi:hypothetical protein
MFIILTDLYLVVIHDEPRYVDQSKFVKMTNTFIQYDKLTVFIIHMGDEADEPIFFMLTSKVFQCARYVATASCKSIS